MKSNTRTAIKYNIPEDDIKFLLSSFPRAPDIDNQFIEIIRAFMPFSHQKDRYSDIIPVKKAEWDENKYHYIMTNFCHL